MTDSARLLNDIVSDINRHGMRVVNLFQLGGGWSATLGPPLDTTDRHDRVFGRGNTPEHALEEAWVLAQKAIAVAPPVFYDGITVLQSPTLPADSADDLLG
jgi:hypothetical protein